MKNEESKMTEFLKRKIRLEAEEIKKEVMSEPGIENIKVTEEMERGLMERIHRYNDDEVLKSLSKDDREALLIGREIKARAEAAKAAGAEFAEKTVPIKHHKRRKRPKVYVAVAAVFVLLFAFGITTIGKPDRVVRYFREFIGGREMVSIDSSEDSYRKETDGDEERAYQRINEELGFDVVRLVYLPEDTIYMKGDIDTKGKFALFEYESPKGNIVYMINSTYTASNFTRSADDHILQEYNLDVSSVAVAVKKYRIVESDEITYSAEFLYKDIYYRISGVREQKEMEKIVKTLFFI